MNRNLSQSGRNCSYFPIDRGRFDSILRMETDEKGALFYMPSGFHRGNVFWRLFFSYFLVGMIAFVVLIVGINNGNWDLARFFQHPLRNFYLIVIGILLLIPFLLIMIKAFRKPFPVIRIDHDEETITAGTFRKGSWKSVDHKYGFTELGAIEVLRNYEYRGEGYIGRPAGNDSYELNLYFHTDDSWLGISESTRRQKILSQADLVSGLTGLPYSENNVSDMINPLPQEGGQGATESGAASMDNLPPFIREAVGESVHEIEINESKLKLKLNPFRLKATDAAGQKFLDLVMPVVSHLVNKVEYSKSLGALRFLCSDRDDDRTTREAKVSELIGSGWDSAGELFNTLSNVYDAQTGSVPGLNTDRDSFERYYMNLKDRIRVSSAKYRLILFEYLDIIIEQSHSRIDKYEENPDSLKKIQNSENYALRFILDMIFVLLIAVLGFFSIGKILIGLITGSLQAIPGRILPSAFTIILIVIWRIVRKKVGGSGR